MPSLHLPHSRRGVLAVSAAVAVVGGAVVSRKVATRHGSATTTVHPPASPRDDALGWGAIEPPAVRHLTTADGAVVAIWDTGEGPAVVLSHCWGGSHAVWLPVARRLVASGHRVVLYDQRGHGESTRGTAELGIATLGRDLALVIEDCDLTGAVLAGHSMGGMTVMALAAERPDLVAQRVRAIVLAATAAADMGSGPPGTERLAGALLASPAVSLALRTPAGDRFVRGVFGANPLPEHVTMVRRLFAATSPRVRASFFASMCTMNLLEGIATIGVPTTVLIGSSDRLTHPARSDQLVAAIAGAELVTLPGLGHMVPLEDPAAVATAIEQAVRR